MSSNRAPQSGKQQPNKRKKKRKLKPQDEARREVNSTLPVLYDGGSKRKEERRVYSDFLRWFLDFLNRF